jgi:hypothetical protein
MKIAKLVLPAVLVLVAGCTANGGASLSGSGAIGVTTDGFYAQGHGGSGPPPGRTQAEREQRKDYYRGPRGDEF